MNALGPIDVRLLGSITSHILAAKKSVRGYRYDAFRNNKLPFGRVLIYHRVFCQHFINYAMLKSLGECALGSPYMVYTHGTLAQWNAVRKGKDNVYIYVRCTDGKTGTGGYHL